MHYHHLPAAVALIAAITGGSAGQTGDCESTLIIYPGIHRLSGDVTVDCVEILPGALLQTGRYILTVEGTGGFTCHSFGRLEINGTGSLRLSGGGAHLINGEVSLAGNGAVVRVDSADSSVSGSGSIAGQDDAARIEIAAGITLTSELLIHGGMIVVGEVADEDGPGNGTFVNDGTLRADSGWTIEMGPTTLLEDQNLSFWESIDDGSVLVFRRAHDRLAGGFSLQPAWNTACARLRFDASITTTGTFQLPFASGCIDINNGAVFSFDDGTITADTGYGGCSCP